MICFLRTKTPSPELKTLEVLRIRPEPHPNEKINV